MAELSDEDDLVYVAVGEEVAESKLNLLWTLRDLRASKLCLLHVKVPSFSFQSSSDPHELVRALREMEFRNMQECLDGYMEICRQEEVGLDNIDSVCITMPDAGEGIVELIYSHNVKKLVMGAAADKHYSEDTVNLMSIKAKYVKQHAPHSCHIWFVCNGRLIVSGTGDFDRFDDARESLSDSGPSTSPSNDSGIVSALVPYQEAGDDEDASSSNSHLQQELHSGMNDDEEIYGQIDRLMTEIENSKRDLHEEIAKRLKAQRDLNKAMRQVRELKIQCEWEQRLRRDAVEAVEKGKEQLEKMKQERDGESFMLSEALEEKRHVEEILARKEEESEQTKIERDETRSALTDAIQGRREAEEALALAREENEKANKDMEEMHNNVVESQQLLEIFKKERDDLLGQRNEAVEVLKAVTEENSSRPPHSGPSQCPSFFVCPILHVVMTDPCVAADGHTYETEALQRWFQSGGDTSPMTGLRLPHRNLVPNVDLRIAIREWLERNPDFEEP